MSTRQPPPGADSNDDLGRVALVTGASRGVGRGIAAVLAESGWRVFGTGRSAASADLPAGLRRLECDHSNEEQTRAALALVADEAEGRLDRLVNSAWGGYEHMAEGGRFTWALPFWEQPMHRGSAMLDVGVRTAFQCSAFAARMMLPRRSGLIVHLSYWAARKHIGNVIYGTAKRRRTRWPPTWRTSCGRIAVLSLYPGLVRTEAVLAAAARGALDISKSESPQFLGKVVAALAGDERVLSCSGRAVVAAVVARELGIRDIDGKIPEPLTPDRA